MEVIESENKTEKSVDVADKDVKNDKVDMDDKVDNDDKVDMDDKDGDSQYKDNNMNHTKNIPKLIEVQNEINNINIKDIDNNTNKDDINCVRKANNLSLIKENNIVNNNNNNSIIDNNNNNSNFAISRDSVISIHIIHNQVIDHKDLNNINNVNQYNENSNDTNLERKDTKDIKINTNTNTNPNPNTNTSNSNTNINSVLENKKSKPITNLNNKFQEKLKKLTKSRSATIFNYEEAMALQSLLQKQVQGNDDIKKADKKDDKKDSDSEKEEEVTTPRLNDNNVFSIN